MTISKMYGTAVNEKICGIIPDSLRYKCIMIMDCRITYSYCVYNSRIN